MKAQDILRRVKEIEAELGDGSTDRYPAPDTISEGRIRWLCRVVRQLVARLEKLEKVAEAARDLLGSEYGDELWDKANFYWNHMADDTLEKLLNCLDKALAALEEGK